MNFLTPQLFDSLIWAVIMIGGALAVLRLYRDLSGPSRFQDDDGVSAHASNGPPGPTDQPPAAEEMD